MPAPDSIAPVTLARVIGAPAAPFLLDLRPAGASSRIPGASRRSPPPGARAVVVIDATGGAQGERHDWTSHQPRGGRA